MKSTNSNKRNGLNRPETNEITNRLTNIDDTVSKLRNGLSNAMDKNRIKEEYKGYLRYYWDNENFGKDSYLSDKLVDVLELGKQILGPEDKDYYKDLVNDAFLKADYPGYWGNRILPKLLEMDVLGKEDIEYVNRLLKKAIEKSKQMSKDVLNGYTDWSGYVIPELLKKDILRKEERKQVWRKQLGRCLENSNNYLRGRAFSNMLKIDNMFDKNSKEDVKYYKNILHEVIGISEEKMDVDYIENILVGLLRLGLNLNIIEKNEVKHEYREILYKDFEKSKIDAYHLRYSIPALLSLEILDKNNEEDKNCIHKLKELVPNGGVELEIWNKYIDPELKKYES